MGGRRFPAEAVAAAVDMVRRGATFEAAASSVGASGHAVGNWCRAAGVASAFAGSQRRPEQSARAVEMVAGGASYAQAADETGLSRVTVIKRCREAGVASTNVGNGTAHGDAVRARAVEMVRGGASYSAAGRAVGAAMATVRKWCVSEGVHSTAKPGFNAGTKIPVRCRPSVKRKPTAARAEAEASRKAERERRRRAAKIHNIWLALMDYRAAVEAAGADV